MNFQWVFKIPNWFLEIATAEVTQVSESVQSGSFDEVISSDMMGMTTMNWPFFADSNADSNKLKMNEEYKSVSSIRKRLRKDETKI